MSRAKGYLAEYRPRTKTRELLEQVREVLDTYEEELPLTLRQIFYRLVGTVGYPKDENAYERLGDHVGNARRAGLIPFESIRDDGPRVLAPLEFRSAEGILQAARNFAASGQGVRQEGQPRWIELWCEAAGMVPQLARVVGEFGITVFSSGGFDSITWKHEAAQRIVAREVPTLALHVGDFDPSGLTMFDVAAEDTAAFAEAEGGEVEFRRVAVTPEQIAAHNLPGAPAKDSSHSKGWRSDTDAVQAEALSPGALAAEVRQAVKAALDPEALASAKAKEAGIRQHFEALMARLEGES